MKRKKKWLSVMLCFAVLAIMAAGCSTETAGDNTDNSSNVTTTIEEQVLFRQKKIAVTATEYVTDSIQGDGIKLLLENNSDKDMTIGCTALIVNDYMIKKNMFVSEVDAGKQANEVLYLSSTQLKEAGIENVGKVEIYFNGYESATLSGYFDVKCVTIQTSEFANMDTTPNDEGSELYNEGGIRIVGKVVDENSFWGTAVLLYCENNSGKNVEISVDDMSINGFIVTPIFTTTIYDGKKAIDAIEVFSGNSEENEIKTIEEVKLNFHIYDVDAFSTIAYTDFITFSAQ